MSLWGTKNQPNENEQDGEENEPRDMTPRGSTERSREPTERDRLLPSNPANHPRGPPHNDGYLDPDDPAVSLHSRHLGPLTSN